MRSDTTPSLRIGNRAVPITNPDKVLYPDAGFAKRDVIEYYRAIAPVMLPHLKDRPVTLKRYPDGVAGKFFFEKRCTEHRPPWVKTADVPSEKGIVHHCLINDAATLVWVANLAALEIHTFLSKARKLDRPTVMVFDLDPGPPATLLDCLPVALRLRELLASRGLETLAKTSGGKGLHLYVPLNTPVMFAQTKAFAEAAAHVLEKDDPARVTSNMRRDLRAGRVLIDWSQNQDHKTTACPYTLRARAEPTVSTPVTWEELAEARKRKSIKPLTFRAGDTLRRVDELGDQFTPVLTLKQKLPRAAG